MPLIPTIRVLRAGNISKPYPFTIVIIANPSLESPDGSGLFATDPVLWNQPAFDACAKYIETSLFGGLPYQRERLLGDPSIAGEEVRIVSIFAPELPPTEENSLVAQYEYGNLLVSRRTTFDSFLTRFGIYADVVYAVSASTTHDRASAYYTSDDDSRPGVIFSLDGQTLHHRYWAITSGTVAIHINSKSLTAVHEFGHALSSYTNGSITDLYVDSEEALNNRHGRPIPVAPDHFREYNGIYIPVDEKRDGLGYPRDWQSYHGALLDPKLPAIMDNYWMASSGIPEQCQHDQITRMFLLDRVRAKMSR